jgi:S-adenosylmethionine-diacylglycerol 3-amino-3-carboxypropyl transferase
LRLDATVGAVTPAAATCPFDGVEPRHRLSLADRIDQKVFDAIYSRSLVYNTCWEDPAVDRRALDITPADTVLVITSAGCNALDYALTSPARVHAVDANPRQSALLELKLAGIRRLAFDDFFVLFGEGGHPRFPDMYRDVLRADLSPFAQVYWDRRTHWLTRTSADRSFYYYGLSGTMARIFRQLLVLRPRMRAGVEALLDARSVDRQREVYTSTLAPAMWTPYLSWMLSRQLTMSMLGVPHPQRKEVERQHAGGIGGFVREAIEYVVQQLPIWTNYFWTLYLQGRYTRENCPEYLRPANFAALKAGGIDRIRIHTCTVTEFLQHSGERISKYVLLDHMDWMSSYHPQALVDEWNAILRSAVPGARAILRSAHEDPAYLHTVRVGEGHARRRLDEVVQFHPRLARELTRDDRVHTYAGFHIADLAV